jgi:uroporphyrin-III C-methyltransferase
MLLGVIALIIALAALAGSYLVWQGQGKNRQALDETRSALEARIGEFPPALAQLESRVGRLGEEVEALAPKLESGLQGELDAFDARLTALHQLLQKTAAPVHEPADIEHLLLIANDSLILQYDVSTALAALQTADERLRALGDPAFAETRRRLAREIASLQATPRPDITGAAFAITGLQQDLESLTLESLRSPAGERHAPSLADALGEDGNENGLDAGWRAMLRDLWTTLGSLVVIRRSDELEGPLIGPEQRVFLNQNLRLKLESARLALLSRDAGNFRHHLDIAQEWLMRYYDDRDPKVAAMLERLEELKGLDIDPAVPDISGSLKALREALERRRAPILDDAGAGPAG